MKKCELINGNVIERDMTQEEIKEMELNQTKFNNRYLLEKLVSWFDDYFDRQLNQSLWQDDFKVSHDYYFNKDYANIDELKAQAKIVRNEIRELRK